MSTPTKETKYKIKTPKGGFANLSPPELPTLDLPTASWEVNPGTALPQKTVNSADTALPYLELKTSSHGGSRQEKTEHKLNTKRTQTEHKPRTKPNTDRTQTKHAQNKLSTGEIKTEHKPDTQPDTRLDTKRTQTEHKPDTKHAFSSLVGLQREATIFAYESCKSTRARTTGPITLEHAASSLKIRIGSVKTTFRRLEEKAILNRIEFKNGRGGWSRYELAEMIYRELLQLETEHKLNTNRTQSAHKVDTQPDTEPDTSLSSSSSILDLEILNTTTTEDKLFYSGIRFTPEWQAVDLNPLFEIGFSQTHLIQIIRHGKLGATEIQDSIHFFAFDLKRNGKAKELNGSPLNFFMGILRKGIPYAPPENYESPVEEARRKILEFKERKERERQVEEQRIKDLEFLEWRRKLSTAEIESLVPEYAQRPGPLQDSALKSHFETQIWPNQQAVDFSKNDFGLNRGLDMEPNTAEEIGKLIDQSLSGAAT